MINHKEMFQKQDVSNSVETNSEFGNSNETNKTCFLR